MAATLFISVYAIGYHAEFGSSALKDVSTNTREPLKLGSAGISPPWGGEWPISLPFPRMCYHVKFRCNHTWCGRILRVFWISYRIFLRTVRRKMSANITAHGGRWSPCALFIRQRRPSRTCAEMSQKYSLWLMRCRRWRVTFKVQFTLQRHRTTQLVADLSLTTLRGFVTNLSAPSRRRRQLTSPPLLSRDTLVTSYASSWRLVAPVNSHKEFTCRRRWWTEDGRQRRGSACVIVSEASQLTVMTPHTRRV